MNLKVMHEPLHYMLSFTPPTVDDQDHGVVTVKSGLSQLVYGYYARYDALEWAFGQLLPTLRSDLADLVQSIHIADRVSPRQSHDRVDPYRMQWRRHLHVQIPLREPEFWRQPEIHDAMCGLLEHFTDDAWSFDFTQRLNVEGPLQQSYLSLLPTNAVVMPFSGGLDSLAGAVDLIESHRYDTLVLCSAALNRRTIGHQRLLRRTLAQRFGLSITPIEVPVHLSESDSPRIESTQRSRGFVFLTLAALAAAQAGAEEVVVAENGIGALALPYNHTMVATHTTRAVHPLSLIRMSEFISRIFGQPFRIRNPFLFRTKAEMCVQLVAHGGVNLIPLSMSCDTFGAHRDARGPQCGLCTSCLLRRQALHAAGLAEIDAPTAYRYDVTNGRLSLTGHQLYALNAMRDQVEQIRACLDGRSPWSCLTMQFPDLAEVRHAVAAFEGRDSMILTEELIRLYRTYVDEWDAFPIAAMPRVRAS